MEKAGLQCVDHMNIKSMPDLMSELSAGISYSYNIP